MGKKKTNKTETNPVDENVMEEVFDTKPVEETVEETPETPKPSQALLEYADFWNNEICGHYRVTPEQAKRFFELYNRVFNANKRYTGCGTCLITVQKKLYNEAKKYDLVK